MSDEKIEVPAILDKLTTLKDHSLKLIFHTNEVSPEMGASLMRMSNQFGYLLFCSSPGQEIAPPAFPGLSPQKKSQSQRLRSSIYKFWETNGSKGDFESFYTQKMEHIINWVQQQI